MQHTDISELMKNYPSYMDKDITVCGWIRSVRDSKQTCFIELNDGTGMKNVQIVIDKNTFTDESVMKQNAGAALEVKGKVVKSFNEKQPFEISPREINVLGASPSDYPLQKKAHSLEFLRTIPHLRVRTNTFNAMFRLRSALAVAIHDFFRSENFTYVHTPIITGSDCEGAGEVFRVTIQPANARLDTEDDYFAQDFFKKRAGLRFRVSLKAKPWPWRLARYTPSALPSERKTPTPQDMPQNSGRSSLRWPLPI